MAATMVAPDQSERGVTLVEVLLAMVVMTILIALALPEVGAVRARARALMCQAHMRSCGLAMVLYASEYGDAWPFGGTGPHIVTIDGLEPYDVGGLGGLSGARWSLLFEDYWSGGAWEPALQCSAQLRFDGTPPPDDHIVNGSLRGPMYYMSSAMNLDPLTLRDGATWGGLRQRMNRTGDTRHPTKKAVLFEQVAFCATGPDADLWVSYLGQTQMFESSVVFVDGSVRRMKRNDGLARSILDEIQTIPMDYTTDGVWGRDVQ